MSTPLVLCVGGRLTSGKDTFADYLVEKHEFVKLGMSDVLAEALKRLDPIIGFRWFRPVRYQQLLAKKGYVGAKKNREVRRLLQKLGTEVGRQLLGEDVWVQAAQFKIEELTSLGNNVVITGIRYQNELNLVDHFNERTAVCASSVWVERNLPIDPNTATHTSENSVDETEFEYELDNTGTLEELYERSEGLLEVIKFDWGVVAPVLLGVIEKEQIEQLEAASSA